MFKITDQYLWNIVFSIFFIILLTMGVIILETESRFLTTELGMVDYVLMVLATWRLVRLFTYDTATKFLREQFLDFVKVEHGYELVKPEKGPRRTLADLFGCPSCISVWMGAVVVFFYLLTPYAFLPTLVLAVSVLATFFQNLGTLINSTTERLKDR